MAGEENGTQVPGASEGAEPGTGEQEATPLTPEQVSAITQEIASLKANQERLDNENRALQSAKDREIAAEKKRGDERIAALQTHIRGQMEQEGASTEELAAFSTEYDRVSQELSNREKAALYDEMQRSQGIEGEVRQFQDRHIKTVSDLVGIVIDPNHPDIKRALTDTPEDFENSVTAVAKKLMAEKGTKEGADALALAADTGALGSLGGATPGGAVNPLAKIKDPEELYRIWVAQGRPIPKPSD